MKPRARRVTLAAAVLGAGVVAVLVVLNWGTVRDHIEAWRFQLTEQTKEIKPEADLRDRGASIEVNSERLPSTDGSMWYDYEPSDLLHALANYYACPVIISEIDPLGWPTLSVANPITVAKVEDTLRSVYSCCVLEQRFPKRACVVIWSLPGKR